MKRVVALAALGLLAPIVQGAVALYLPRATCPDVALLLVIAVGVALRSTAGGVVFVAWIGFVSSQLSGSLQGQHALLWLLAFGLARLISLRVNLQGPFAQMALAAVLTLASAFGLAALTAFFASGAAPLASGGELLWHTGVNALMAPLVVGLATRLLAKLGGDDGRRVLRLEPRSLST